MHDAFYCGKRFRTLNVLDEGERECLGIEIDTSLPAARAVRLLEQVSAWHGFPKKLFLDNVLTLLSSFFQDKPILYAQRAFFN